MKRISIEIDCKRLSLAYSDSGPGIAYENREEVFRPFFTLKPAGKGKGLGLYIAREIAEYHGASLFLAEDEDHGPPRARRLQVLSASDSEASKPQLLHGLR
ncbi:ATP-binding protein [Thalassoglobus neptunius]|uniref:ATP-binding protein n=1 Tax=Thalassoglobus neptunius TaxID=1938619 RepID=UPI0011B4C7E7